MNDPNVRPQLTVAALIEKLRTFPPELLVHLGSSELVLAGATTGRFFAEGTGTYSEPIALTWANLAAAQPGGFGGSAHNPQRNAHAVNGAM